MSLPYFSRIATSEFMDFLKIWPLYLAEFIGTFFLVFFGCGSIILAELNPDYAAAFIPIVWGATVSIMIYSVGHISGAHFNPAVTLAFTVIKKFPFKRVPGYLLAQILGAILASLFHFYIFGNQHSFGMTEASVALTPALLIEFLLGFSLMFVIVSVATDSRAVGEMAGLAIGTTVSLCAFVGGPMTGASMNPARSIAPALISGNFYNLWIYLIIPIISTAVGAFVYDTIRCHKSVNDSKHGCC